MKIVRGAEVPLNIPVNFSSIGVDNGTSVEYQFNAVAACEILYGQTPEFEGGSAILPESSGLGLTPNDHALKTMRDTREI